MHAPDKFGDDLSPFRKTVAYVNKTHLPVSGFEEGVANDGYRFVFPLFESQGYIGSVELSFSAYVLADFLKSEFLDTRFIIARKSIIRQNPNYIPSDIDPDFVTDRRYLENSRLFPHDERFRSRLRQNPAAPFSLDETIDGNTYIETFLPIQNSITKSTDAYMVILSPAPPGGDRSDAKAGHPACERELRRDGAIARRRCRITPQTR